MSDTQSKSSPKIPIPLYLCSESVEGSIGECDEKCKAEVLVVARVDSETPSEVDFSEESEIFV